MSGSVPQIKASAACLRGPGIDSQMYNLGKILLLRIQHVDDLKLQDMATTLHLGLGFMEQDIAALVELDPEDEAEAEEDNEPEILEELED